MGRGRRLRRRPAREGFQRKESHEGIFARPQLDCFDRSHPSLQHHPDRLHPWSHEPCHPDLPDPPCSTRPSDSHRYHGIPGRHPELDRRPTLLRSWRPSRLRLLWRIRLYRSHVVRSNFVCTSVQRRVDDLRQGGCRCHARTNWHACKGGCGQREVDRKQRLWK